MRILVSNDDGIFSPGLRALAEVAALYGDVRVVAPDIEQSAKGHAVTIQRPLRYHATEMGPFEAYRVNGTPADCVAMGLYRWDTPDLVLSGINLGSNLGHEIWHSGTVAASKQASLLGVRAIAFSLALEGDSPDFEPLKPYIERVLLHILEHPTPRLVNVNLPQRPEGIQWTFQSVRSYMGKVVEGCDPLGREHYWFVGEPTTQPETGSDRWAVNHKLVALTPLHLDVTDRKALATLPSGPLENL